MKRLSVIGDIGSRFEKALKEIFKGSFVKVTDRQTERQKIGPYIQLGFSYPVNRAHIRHGVEIALRMVGNSTRVKDLKDEVPFGKSHSENVEFSLETPLSD